MEDASRRKITHGGCPTGRSKVKTGCRTCKIRKVKCDEGRPACRRCISTGRNCDGYGVWGGGSNLYSRRQQGICGADDRGTALKPTTPLSMLPLSGEEYTYFEWFKCRTSKKIPGMFVLGFWDSLLFQASMSEPAVLHAILTLSSVHKRDIVDPDNRSGSDAIDQQERFMLQHYSKAISLLQPQFLSRNRSSARITLIACVVFVCLEYLRGHFRTAQIHLQNGLRILREVQDCSSIKGDGMISLPTRYGSTDGYIDEAFHRLHTQVALFQQGYQHFHFMPQEPCVSTPPVLVYHSINEAWTLMGQLLNSIFYLTEQSRLASSSSALHKRQQVIQSGLSQWLKTYEASKNQIQKSERRHFDLLHTYYNMANIMSGACLRPHDESMYDSYTDDFITLLERATNVWKMKTDTMDSVSLALPGHQLNMSSSIVDIGWIPPLYYTALKCRVHRLRLHAIRLIESTSHREGIWDAKIAACVARKVMELEEGDFYKDIDIPDDFLLSSLPEVWELTKPSLPLSHRFQVVKVVLPDGPMDNLTLCLKQKLDEGSWKVLSKSYSIISRCWTDEISKVDTEA